MDDKRKDHMSPETPSQKNKPKELETLNEPTYDGENTNGTNKAGDLLFVDKLQIVLKRTERMLQRI